MTGNIRRILLTIAASVLSSYIYAQRMDEEHMCIGTYVGNSHMLNVLNLHDNLLLTTDCLTAGINVGVRTKPSDRNYWAWAWNLPTYGIGFSYMNTGSLKFRPGSSLSDVYTLYGYSHFDLVRVSGFTFGPNIEFGVSYTSKTWDPVTNPANFFVGTQMLVMVGAGLEAGYHITPQWEAGVSAMLTHRSNGMARVPNHGLNEIRSSLYVRYNLNGQQPRDCGPKPEEPEYKKLSFDVYFSAGVHNCDVERVVYQDIILQQTKGQDEWRKSKQWLRLNLGGMTAWRYHPLLSTGIGMDLTYTQNWRRLEEYTRLKIKHDTGHDSEETTCPVYLGAYIQQSFHYRNLEIGIGLGVYLFKRLGIEDSTWNYQRVMMRYHFPELNDLFVSFGFRANMFDRSDNLEFTVGKRF